MLRRVSQLLPQIDKVDGNPIEDQPLITSGDGLDETGMCKFLGAASKPFCFVIGPHDESYLRKAMEGPVARGRDRSLLAKRTREGGRYPPSDANNRPPPKGYIGAMGAAADDVGGINGLQVQPNMSVGQSESTWGMQGALVLLMFAACYMLYILLKKRVCSLSCGWKDKDDGDLELGRLRDA